MSGRRLRKEHRRGPTHIRVGRSFARRSRVRAIDAGLAGFVPNDRLHRCTSRKDRGRRQGKLEGSGCRCCRRKLSRSSRSNLAFAFGASRRCKAGKIARRSRSDGRTFCLVRTAMLLFACRRRSRLCRLVDADATRHFAVVRHAQRGERGTRNPRKEEGCRQYKPCQMRPKTNHDCPLCYHPNTPPGV